MNCKTAIIFTVSALFALNALAADTPDEQPREKFRQTRNSFLQEEILSMESYTEPVENDGSVDLKLLAEQLNMLDLPSPDREKQKTQNQPRQKETSPARQTKSASEKQQQNAKVNNKSLAQPDQSDPAIRALLQNPDRVKNPVKIADSLYLAGRIEQAGFFYNLAIERFAGEQDNPDRPWALYQAATCLKKTEQLNLAKQMYDTLVKDYPQSKWTKLAITQSKSISWITDPQTIEMLEKYTDDPNSL